MPLGSHKPFNMVRGSTASDDYVYRDNLAPLTTGFTDKKTAPGKLTVPKPNFASKAALLNNEAVALFTFVADQPSA